ncbi:MAG: glycerate kinase [Burkholderiales bacterium]|nr:glycerate kinase [Burkholderiales bacterium]
MRIVLAPDSFKGSLSAPQVCTALARGLRQVMPDAEIVVRPMADGGEGTLDAVLAAAPAGARRETARVTGAGGEPVDAAYGVLAHDGTTTAIIEAAQVVGITDQAAMRVSVRARSTQGLGELLRHLLDRGIRRFVVGLGGSSTNDGGSGLLAALGAELVDGRGKRIAPTPDGLAALARIAMRDVDARLAHCDIRILSDVNNPLTGTLGATAIFGPQKGVQPDEVAAIDATLAAFARIARDAFGRDVADRPGAGAAGGLGFAFQLLGATMQSGAEVVAEQVGLDAALADAQWALTGEGRSDRQTLLAKAPYVVARHAAKHGVPVTLVSGAVDHGALDALGAHFAGCFGLADGPMDLAACIANAAALLEARAANLARLVLAHPAVRSPRSGSIGAAPGEHGWQPVE